MDVDQELYVKRGLSSIFSATDRLKLINSLLRAPIRDGGCSIHVFDLMHKNIILGFFPIHNNEPRFEILNKCLAWSTIPITFPFEAIREYYGEKVALVYVFMGFMTSKLILPSLLGMVAQYLAISTYDLSHPSVCIVVVIVSVWSVNFLQQWRREEVRFNIFAFMPFQADYSIFFRVLLR